MIFGTVKSKTKNLLKKVIRVGTDPVINSHRDEMMDLLIKSYYTLNKSILEQRNLVAQLHSTQSNNSVIPRPKSNDTLNESVAKLAKIVPLAVELWQKCQNAGEGVYQEAPTENCAVDGHRTVSLFKAFLAPYLQGTILDIGCGPQNLPAYLANYPLHLVAGIDPLSNPEDHGFIFHKGLAEYLPWEDKIFNRVIVSTSLDHMIMLDKAFAEICRVLTDDGIFLTWIGFVPGAKKYDPFSPNLKTIDQYHIFHFDRPWFEEMVKEYFDIEEVYEIFYPQYGAVIECFYALKPKKS